MPLSSASLLENATVSASGGSALALESEGTGIDRNNLYVPSDSDIRTRRTIDCFVSRPKVQVSAPNGYTQARASVILKIPRVLDNGNTSVDTLRIQYATDVETSSSEKDNDLSLAAQILSDSDFTSFFKNLSVV